MWHVCYSWVFKGTKQNRRSFWASGGSVRFGEACLRALASLTAGAGKEKVKIKVVAQSHEPNPNQEIRTWQMRVVLI
jgi:hypothetical protein